MTSLADLEIGIGVKGMKSLQGDFDKVPRIADQAVSKSEMTFEGMDARFPGVEDGAEDAADGAVSIFDGMAGPLAAVVGAAGAAAGAVLVHEFMDAMEGERLADRLGAQLALSEAESEEAGQIAGDLYAGAWGDSLAEVHDAVGQVASTLVDEFDGAAVEDLSAKALDLAAAFDVEVGEAVNTIGVMMRTGLARDAEQGFDLVVAAMQTVPAEMRGELLPILEEYSTNFASLGIEGPEAMALLVGAADLGRFALDKTGDAIKEFGILATEETTPAVVEAFETIGLDADVMAEKILTGGATAREGLDQTVDGLLAVEDKSARAQLAVDLFGAPVEDLSKEQIPVFLDALQGMDDGFGSAEGAATRMGDQLNDNVATDFQSFKNTAGAAIDDWIEIHVLPGAAEVLDAFSEDGVGGALTKAVELLEASQPEVQAWWDGTFTPFWEDTATPWMNYVGGLMGQALLNGIIQAIVDGQFALVNSFQELVRGIAADVIGTEIENIPGGGDIGFDVPDLDLGLTPPDSGGGNYVPQPTGTYFHGGGWTPFGGMATLAAKERVLDPRQTAAFEDLVDHLTGGPQVPRVAAVSDGGQSSMAAVYLDGRRVGDAVIDHMAKHTRRGGKIVADVVRQ